MANPAFDFGLMVYELLKGLLDTAVGLSIAGLIGYLIYSYFNKPQEINWGKEIFKKNWEATVGMGLRNKKKLVLCTFPFKSKEIDKPWYQIPTQEMGQAVGLNFFGIYSNIETLKTYAKDPKNSNWDRVIEENKEFIKNDKFWVVLAYERTVSGFPMATTKKSLLFAKPDQIISINDSDDTIRLRGHGRQSIGENEIITDDNINYNRMQLTIDNSICINQEILLSAWSNMGETVTRAMKANPEMRASFADKCLGVLGVHNEQK